MEKTSAHADAQNRLDRWVCAGVGLLFVGLAAAIVLSSDAAADIWVYLAAAVIGALGVDALVAAARKRRSVLSRVGPLP
jgi:hypothetical protein